MKGPCMCGDTGCPSCGTAQGTYQDVVQNPLQSEEFADQLFDAAGRGQDLELMEAWLVAMSSHVDDLEANAFDENIDPAPIEHLNDLLKQAAEIIRGWRTNLG